MEDHFRPTMPSQAQAQAAAAGMSQDEKPRGETQPYMASLRSVRKPPTKPWKKPEPPPPKIYRVDPHGFRRLVQSLTGMHSSEATADSQRSSLRQSITPPPKIEVASRQMMLPTVAYAQTSWPQFPTDSSNGSKVSGDNSPIDIMSLLSPSFFSNLNSLPLHSPGSMAASELR